MARALQVLAFTMAALLLRGVQGHQFSSTAADENVARRSLTDFSGGEGSTGVDPLRVDASGGCILGMDSRSLGARSEEETPWTYFEERGRNLPFWVATKFINKHYAEKHGYRYVFKRPSAFIVPNGKEEPRADAWYKIKLMKEQLLCCCRWIFFVDSDAYFRMNSHSLSIEEWLGKLNESDYFAELESKGVDLQNQIWYPEHPLRLLESDDSDTKLIALIPRNSDNQNGFCREELNFLRNLPATNCPDFFNSGIMMLRNTTLTIEFLDDWYNEQRPQYLLSHPWEQRNLNMICNKYRDHIVAVPYMEATGPEGRQIRHVWGDVGSTRRHSRIREAALGVVAAMAMESGA